jgi:hypothetical protein
MEGEFVSADSKGLIGALNPLLCITFELRKNGASLGRGAGEFETTRGERWR